MNTSQRRRETRNHRKVGIRRKLSGTDIRPRVSVFRSNRHIYAQVISDQSGKTLGAASSLGEGASNVTKADAASVGTQIAEKCKALSITEVVFDRNGYKYHGSIKALADAAREAGLKF